MPPHFRFLQARSHFHATYYFAHNCCTVSLSDFWLCAACTCANIELKWLTKSDLTVGSQQNVAGLEVAMNDKVLMQEVKCLTHLVTNTTYLWLSQRLLQFLHDAVDRAAATELYIHLWVKNNKAIIDISLCPSACIILSTTTPPLQNSMYICESKTTTILLHDAVYRTSATELYIYICDKNNKAMVGDVTKYCIGLLTSLLAIPPNN